MIRRKRLLWQLFPSYLLITLVSLLAVTLYASSALRDFYHQRTANDLEAMALLVEQRIQQPIIGAKPDIVDQICRKLGKRAGMRITAILPSGKVLGDSEESVAKMDNHADRPEIVIASGGKTGSAIRYSHTLGQDMMYVAIPVRHDGKIKAILRMAVPLTSLDIALREIHIKIAAGSLVVAVLAALVSLLVSRRISRPLEEIKHGAKRFAQGDFSVKLPVEETLEFGELAETMNMMAADLNDKISALIQERNEREAVLSSMIEGVLAVDMQQRLISLNNAGARLVGTDIGSAHGRILQEVVRNPGLQQLVADVISTQQPDVKEIVFHEEEEERFIQVHGTVLRDAEQQSVGVVMVLQDVTRIKRLENVRKDFVANVSHELRTPVTSIKGYTETLIDGAISDPEKAGQFLRVIAAQADRLNAIIEDLLSLCRIEQDAEKVQIPLNNECVKDALKAAIGICQLTAAEKNIQFQLNCPDELRADINSTLFEQAIVNLIDNAIKYSSDNGTVEIGVSAATSETVLTVRDYGCGMESKHLPRIFERFYRVDKARSRKLGGTGLGLAIVKHIVQAHGGQITVESRPNVGTTFSIHLPNA